MPFKSGAEVLYHDELVNFTPKRLEEQFIRDRVANNLALIVFKPLVVVEEICVHFIWLLLLDLLFLGLRLFHLESN